ncbi:MAG: CHAT domain-containing tetratricopeptide repeat protein [Bacteroidia bacterium]
MEKEDSSHLNIFNRNFSYTGNIESFKEVAVLNSQNYLNYYRRLGCIYAWYSKIYNNIGAIYIKMQKYDKALKNIYLAWNYTQNSGGLIKRGKSYLAMDYTQNSAGLIEHGQPAFSLTNKCNGNTEYNFSLLNRKKETVHLASVSHNIGEYNRTLAPIIDLTPTLYLSDPNNFKIGIDLSSLFSRRKAYKEAIKNYKYSQKKYKKAFGKRHEECAIQLTAIGHVYYSRKRYKKALRYYKEAHDLFEKGLYKGHPDDIWALIGIGKIYWQKNQFDRVLKNATEQFISSKSYLLNNIFSLSENIKSNFRNYSNWYFSNAYSTRRDGDSSFQWLYDHELFQRGLELESVSGLAASVQRDTTLKELWNNYNLYKNILGKEYLNGKYILGKEYLNPNSSKKIDLSPIENKAAEFEKELLAKSAPYRSWKERVNITWQDVQKHLSNEEAAIEFVSFKYISYLKTDSTIYAALVITSNMKYPKLIFLFEEKQFAGLLQNASTSSSNISGLYTARGVKVNSTSNVLQYGDSLFKLIWRPLLPYLENIKTISFVPDGLLNKINIIAIPGYDGKPLCQDYHFKQMLSTRSVAFPEIEPAQQPAVLSGGIDYNYDIRKNTLPKSENTSISLVELVSRSRGNEFDFLNGAKEEVENIGSMYKTKNMAYHLVEGKYASENSFKQMDGNSPAVLHLATHGFFFPPHDRNKKSDASVESNYSLAEDPLLRSGIVLAGGNYAWKNGSNPYEDEDGILTAYEISHLNLSSTNLVVLSACETGLGDIKGTEGVYGLQRAFKIAGVKYIMMSLWQIPDKETQEFMQSFYARWLNGQSIHESFRQTQIEMAVKYDPYKWAAFVLVE